MGRDEFKILATIILVLLLLIALFNYQAQKITQQKLEKRALKLKKKDCYDWQDIEYIIFGEIQE